MGFHTPSKFSFKLPATFDVRRNDEAVKKRIEEIRTIIKPYLSDPSWVVLAGDEPGLRGRQSYGESGFLRENHQSLKFTGNPKRRVFWDFSTSKPGYPSCFLCLGKTNGRLSRC